MSMTQALLKEFENEAGTTRRVLERVPTDKLTWKPHPKSMSLGTLALHVASSPGVIIGWCCEDETTFTGQGPAEPTSTEEILAAHDASVKKVKETIPQIGDEGILDIRDGRHPVLEQALSEERFVMNHWVHHRGQLSVYLRLLDVPVPSIYGPSADENPFAART